MRVKLLIAASSILAVACGSMASAAYIHVHRPVDSLGELGVYCSNGGDPTVVGMEEKYLILSCGK